MTELPEFANPPVAEVVIGIQFRPLFGMRGLALAPLRERWLKAYPKLEEQLPLPPTVEGGGPATTLLQFNITQVPQVRQWFLNESGTELVQVQHDRLIVNWRAGDPLAQYPRYRYMRGAFISAFADLAEVATDGGLGELDITQAELSYINAIEIEHGELGRIDRLLDGWSGVPGHHLGEPEQARVTLMFVVPGLGQPPVHLYVEISPAQRANGEPVLFLTLTIRGNPGGRSIDESLKFLDEAHQHLVRSFAELTKESMRELWGRRA